MTFCRGGVAFGVSLYAPSFRRGVWGRFERSVAKGFCAGEYVRSGRACSVVSSWVWGRFERSVAKGFCVGNTSVRSEHAPSFRRGVWWRFKRSVTRNFASGIRAFGRSMFRRVVAVAWGRFERSVTRVLRREYERSVGTCSGGHCGSAGDDKKRGRPQMTCPFSSNRLSGL